MSIKLITQNLEEWGGHCVRVAGGSEVWVETIHNLRVNHTIKNRFCVKLILLKD
ncbi:hypothetical protein MTo_04138 [Microcystis aeruginosa NIES-1211]|uniref:Uncharacterized protein n=1 Tax=Microcystis aeruginosa NIES-2519 TaxID=2303981 RepID=A0A5A5R2P2_MICAE|nr:hypothetical protein MTo_04138 [Microcystis aeruginosa NIES-1211]GCA70444.1 hypothetical protein MiYa_01976 [Microcystis aeruginosa NIES-2519]GCA83075.1 hypothetical protein MiHa_01033 [Microcystis aeruginosa NIES-2522]